MTCIVALRQKRRVYMACDSAGIAGYSACQRVDPKIYRVGEALIGFTDSFRMGQLLGHNLTLPTLPTTDADLFGWMVREFIDVVRGTLKRGGFAKVENGVDAGGTFLVAIRRRIFRIAADYQVGESADPYDACGCGEDIARAALFTSSERIEPRKRLAVALAAAEHFSAGVRRPFKILEGQ